ncbi:ribonuclease H-like superfamily protein, partial [Striga asiatica]
MQICEVLEGIFIQTSTRYLDLPWENAYQNEWSTRLWCDPWIPNSTTSLPMTGSEVTRRLTYWVGDLLEDEGRTWNDEFLADFYETDRINIKKINSLNPTLIDRWTWVFYE